MSQFLDARELEFTDALQADICIIGAGAAGITLARYLSSTGLDVIMLESGGMSLEGATQALYQTERQGLPYYDLTVSRLRYFGGTSNHWAGYCRPNDSIDFAGRPELGIAPWAVGEAELAPYMRRAATDLGLSMEGFDINVQAQQHGLDPSSLPDSHSADLQTKVFQLTSRKLQGSLWHDNLARQSNLRVILHANVTRLNAAPSGDHIESVKVQVLDGKGFQVNARQFVLATHAIENARLLLDSDNVVPAGLGNQHDQVGRHFMEHPQLISGTFTPNERFLKIYDAGAMLKQMVNINLSLQPKTMIREGILQYYTRFLPAFETDATKDDIKILREGFWKPGDLKALFALGRVVGDIPNSYKHLLTKLHLQPAKAVAFHIDHRIEQAPNPNSRVTLSDKRDALGCRKAILNWAFNDLDYRTFAKGSEIVLNELQRLKLGTVSAKPLTPVNVDGLVRGHFHNIGTTRMSDKPETGVVDANLKVHGIDNLYIAGASVYPTAGYGGPTMMLMAFAMRLAEHLITLKRVN